MKKLKLTINGEVKIFDLPENGDYKVEVVNKYLPQVGDCVKVECINLNKTYFYKTNFYWFKVKEISKIMVDFSLAVGEDLKISEDESFVINNSRIYTQITPEELKAKYAEAGYDWDYETDTIKPLKWMPKEGDCVTVKHKEDNILYWSKLTSVTATIADFKLSVNSNLNICKNGFFVINEAIIYTKITPEELKAKYAEAGYDWDYETDTITPIKWIPKDGDTIWYLMYSLKPISSVYYSVFHQDLSFFKNLLDKGLLFPTEEECQKFADHCMKYINKNK